MIQSTGRAGSTTVPVTPLYRRIVDDITAKIRSGEWPVGTVIPTPAVLAEAYSAEFGDVSAGTVRRSLDILQDRGVLEGHQGKHVVVARVPD